MHVAMGTDQILVLVAPLLYLCSIIFHVPTVCQIKGHMYVCWFKGMYILETVERFSKYKIQ
jgi:hypothetical protein